MSTHLTGTVAAALALALLFVLYAYVLFPAGLALVSRLRRRERPVEPGDWSRPVVTVIVPAYNEKDSLGTRLRNLLEADYPRKLLDIIVVSDASTDGTTALARTHEALGDIRLIVQEERRGKSHGLNRAVSIARGDILVFTDANAMFTPGTIGALVDCFCDPRVGLATGYTNYSADENGQLAETTGLYTRLERTIKAAEGTWGCCVGADGAVFAMRRSLYLVLRDDDINDFVLPLQVIEQGFRCVFAAGAVCIERPGKSIESEFGRQSRITNRTLRAMWRHARLLNPLRFPAFAFFAWSHKLIRFLFPVYLTLAAIVSAVLSPALGIALVVLAAALVATIVFGVPTALARLALPAPLRIAQVFVTMNAAMLQGWWKFLTGRSEITWQHDRSRGTAA